MATTLIQFNTTRETFANNVKEAVISNSLEGIEKTFGKIPGSDAEKKSALDQVFRDELLRLIAEDSDCDSYKKLVTLSSEAVKHDVCSATIPFVMLSDLMDTITLEKCEIVFELVEEKVTLWKSEIFYNAGKNYLLRLCNDILKRLSKSQNTVFCGRIQQFLAKLFPLSEKSGLNLMSEFNLGNETQYMTTTEEYDTSRKQSIEEKDETMDIEEGETDDFSSSIPIDYNLYRKFWSLQDYFRRPVQCYDKIRWKTFTNHSEEVFNCFESFKLDDMKVSKKKVVAPDGSQSQVFFAKFLTSEKLLDLQLSDSQFRRYVLLQFLILFHYLHATVKFKSATQVLTDEQSTWVKKTSERIYQILKETPPDGAKYAKAIEHILSREDNWNSWKNESCPSYVRKPCSSQDKSKSSISKKRSIGDDVKAAGGKFIKMGNSELTRLWNLCPDNLEACRQKGKTTEPTVEEFFEEAIDQADPTQMVEDQYKLVRKPNFQWKALRLLTRHSSLFFTQSIHPVRTLHEYLEGIMIKMAATMPTSTEDMKTELEDEDKDDTTQEENLDNQDNEEAKEEQIQPLTNEEMEAVANELQDKWKQLALELNFPEDEISYFESETEDVPGQALKMITMWKENEGERATPAALRSALIEIGQVSIAENALGSNGTP